LKPSIQHLELRHKDDRAGITNQNFPLHNFASVSRSSSSSSES
jgi:hypothetical protein